MSVLNFLISSWLLALPCCLCYCPQWGRNPSFNGPPTVSVLSLTEVSVSWRGVVDDLDCVDQFLVKFWPVSAPSDYGLSEFFSPQVTSASVTVRPRIPYVFQVKRGQ